MIQIFPVRLGVYLALHGLWWLGELPLWVAPLLIAWRELDFFRVAYLLPKTRRMLKEQAATYQQAQVLQAIGEEGLKKENWN